MSKGYLDWNLLHKSYGGLRITCTTQTYTISSIALWCILSLSQVLFLGITCTFNCWLSCLTASRSKDRLPHCYSKKKLAASAVLSKMCVYSSNFCLCYYSYITKSKLQIV